MSPQFGVVTNKTIDSKQIFE